MVVILSKVMGGLTSSKFLFKSVLNSNGKHSKVFSVSSMNQKSCQWAGEKYKNELQASRHCTTAGKEFVQYHIQQLIFNTNLILALEQLLLGSTRKAN